MRITFINPNISDMRSADAMQPLAFGILSALTPPDIERRLLDERLEKINFEHKTDLVVLSVQTFTARRAYNIAGEFRKRRIKVIMGGFHPTLVPAEATEYADSLVLGEAETQWPRVLEDFRQGKLKKIYSSAERWIGQGIIPDRSIFAGKKYSLLQPVQFGRGCHNRCSFCSVHAFYGKQVTHRPVEEVIAEISRLKGRFLFFVDDNLITNYQAARELFRALKSLHKYWVCQLSVEAACDESLVALMAASGCLAVFIGFESMNLSSLQDIRKTRNLEHNNYLAVVQKFKQHGIMVTGAFVFGADSDTQVAFAQAYDFAMQAKLCLCHFNPLFPTPGTPLYARLKQENRLIYSAWWLDADYRYGALQFYPLNMPPEQVTDTCFQLRRRFNTRRAVMLRALDRHANARTPLHLGVFILANLLSRREIYKKQGIKLG